MLNSFTSPNLYCHCQIKDIIVICLLGHILLPNGTPSFHSCQSTLHAFRITLKQFRLFIPLSTQNSLMIVLCIWNKTHTPNHGLFGSA